MENKVIEQVPLVKTTYRLPRDLHRQVKVYCAQHEMSVEAFVVEALEARLAQEQKA
jgi:plasmid stability protein